MTSRKTESKTETNTILKEVLHLLSTLVTGVPSGKYPVATSPSVTLASVQPHSVAEQDAEFIEYCRVNSLVAFEIIAYSVRTTSGNAPTDMKAIKEKMQEIYNCKKVQSDSGVNSGSMSTLTVFPVEIKQLP